MSIGDQAILGATAAAGGTNGAAAKINLLTRGSVLIGVGVAAALTLMIFLYLVFKRYKKKK